MAHPGDDEGFAVYTAYVEKVLESQDSRKTSIEQRGLAVITTSGTLVTLLFAVIGLATREAQTYSLSHDARWWLIAAVALLVGAALFGLATNIPTNRYRNVDPKELTTLIDRNWSEDAWSASGRVSRTRVGIYEAAKDANELKAKLLITAVASEAVALVH